MDSKTTAVRSLTNSIQLFQKDLQALPEEAFTKKFGSATRTVADIVYEVNLVNDHVGMAIRGEEPFEWPDEQWIKAPADFHSKEVVIGAFDKSTKKILETADSFTAEQFDEMVQTEHGERSRFERFQFMTLHMWYHCGQLNFIQTLLGDDSWHWK
jgi:uncharacterized damage-inducible protein DinB